MHFPVTRDQPAAHRLDFQVAATKRQKRRILQRLENAGKQLQLLARQARAGFKSGSPPHFRQSARLRVSPQA
jgi:hypothetical protein